MKIQLIRNATLRLNFAGRRYLIDPWLSAKGEGLSYHGEYRSPLVELPVAAGEVLRDIDAVLVSHLHSDHFDQAARTALPEDIRLHVLPATQPGKDTNPRSWTRPWSPKHCGWPPTPPSSQPTSTPSTTPP